MLHLKQILHKNYTLILKTILKVKTDLQLLGVVPQNYLFQENLGKLLYCLILLVNITVLTAVTFSLLGFIIGL